MENPKASGNKRSIEDVLLESAEWRASQTRKATFQRIFNWKVVTALLLVLDISSVALSVLCLEILAQFALPPLMSSETLFVLFFSQWMLVTYYYGGLYEIKNFLNWQPEGGNFPSIVVLTLGTLGLLSLVLNAFGSGFGVIGFALVLGTFVINWALRSMAAWGTTKALESGWMGQTIAIVGCTGNARHFITQLGNQLDARWWKVVGVFDDRTTRQESQEPGLPVAGSLEDLVRSARAGMIQQVVVALPWSATERVNQVLDHVMQLPVMVSLAYPDALIGSAPRPNLRYESGTPAFDLNKPPAFGIAGLSKWLEDRVLSAFILLLFSPVLLAAAIAIKLDSPGPVFFRQTRYGFNNEKIRVFKFRSMTADSSSRTDFQQATKNDPRITRVGAFLRRTSIDELPQLLNVLSGSMSLVGPRPHPVALNDSFAAHIPGIEARHNLKPGITGLAQINGFRGETDTLEKMQGRIELDRRYIEQWSIWLDLKILFKTAFKGWVHDNAY